MNLHQNICDILAKITRDQRPYEWDLDYNFIPGDLDSLDTATLALGIEESFSVKIADDEIEYIKSINQIISLIQKKLDNKID